MANDWRNTKLSECATFQEGYVNPSQKKEEYFDGSIKWLRATDLNNGFVRSTGRTLSEVGFKSAGKSAKLFKPGTLAISKSGTIGRVGILCDYMCGNRAVINIVVDEDFCSNKFIFYQLRMNRVFFETMASGSVQKNLYTSVLGSLEFKLPSLPEQKAIAHILGSLDDKIELNRQMNETLQEMAQALFKSWFVDFDPVIDNALAAGNAIPDEFTERAEQRKGTEKKDNVDIQNLFPNEFEFTEEMGWIPKGWKNGTLADICCYAKGKINTSELNLENYVSTENMNKEKAGISYAASIASTNQVPKFSVGQTLISNIRPYFKKIWLASFSGGRSNDVLGFQANDSVATEYLFSLLYQDSFFDYMTATSKGTKMPRGDKAAIMSWSIAIPPLILMEEFSSKVKPMYLANQIRSTQEISLSKLRDTLLPKLMSGELRIPDAEKLVENI